MCPTFGAEPRFGTHPMAWAAPGGKNEADFLFDVATSQVKTFFLDLFYNFPKKVVNSLPLSTFIGTRKKSKSIMIILCLKPITKVILYYYYWLYFHNTIFISLYIYYYILLIWNDNIIYVLFLLTYTSVCPWKSVVLWMFEAIPPFFYQAFA